MLRIAVLPVPIPRNTRPGCHRRNLHRRDARAADRGAGSDAQARRLPSGEREHGVAVGIQHLAVGDPDGVVAERFGVTEKADLVDVGHHGEAEFHGCSDPAAALYQRPHSINMHSAQTAEPGDRRGVAIRCSESVTNQPGGEASNDATSARKVSMR
jgi:hypothetical protein